MTIRADQVLETSVTWTFEGAWPPGGFQKLEREPVADRLQHYLSVSA